MIITVHTPTKEDFLDVCEDQNKKYSKTWFGISNEHLWDSHRNSLNNNTAVIINEGKWLTYANKDYCIKHKYLVLSTEEYFTQFNIKIELTNIKLITSGLFFATYKNRKVICINNDRGASINNTVNCIGTIQDNKVYITQLGVV